MEDLDLRLMTALAQVQCELVRNWGWGSSDRGATARYRRQKEHTLNTLLSLLVTLRAERIGFDEFTPESSK